MKEGGFLRITLSKSGIGRPAKHKATLQALGLTKLHKTVVLKDTPAIRGMIQQVNHLVEVTESDQPSANAIS
ncbi:MAG: 50S ribosomal protein L30 [Candidatus Tectomicrobia bacterium]|uniref:50S ribosomal protein L30 n=1 Tax=Tectimicrobiota bacterium TaxID=2528274 RepID=A0A932FXU4_UNCTE|nr:50S ribosomal protein L30 [Candidatus Tectomicrobia bacterium]